MGFNGIFNWLQWDSICFNSIRYLRIDGPPLSPGAMLPVELPAQYCDEINKSGKV